MLNNHAVVIRKSGNLLEISNLPQQLKFELEAFLTYEHKKFLYGWQRKVANRRVQVTPKRLFKYDACGRLICGAGFLTHIQEAFALHNQPVTVQYLDQSKQLPVNVNSISKHFSYREKQEECLRQIISQPCGVIHAPTGFGKMVLIAMTCLAFPNARIDIVTRRLRLVNKLVEFLSRCLGPVGHVDGNHRSQERVTVYSVGSLHHSSYDADILIAEECQMLMSNDSIKYLARYRHSRNYAFTASPTGRLDGADIRLECLFGPIIFSLSYPEAVQLGLVVPIQVQWDNVRLKTNPCASITDEVQKKRFGLWQNQERNAIIAKAARRFPDEQVLISVETIEHGVYLRQLLPEFTLVYDTVRPRDLRHYQSEGLWSPDLPVLTARQKEEMRQDFETGKLKKTIATSVLQVGIDPIYLSILVRADGACSEIVDIQTPGRVSRINDQGKQVGIVCAFRDQFDDGLRRKANISSQHYEAMGWEQIYH